MKDFARDETRFSLCGLNCLLCPMRTGGYCPGCGSFDKELLSGREFNIKEVVVR